MGWFGSITQRRAGAFTVGVADDETVLAELMSGSSMGPTCLPSTSRSAAKLLTFDRGGLSEWSKPLRPPSPTETPYKKGGVSWAETNMNMDRFIRRQNVALYRRLLERVTEESERQKIINLLTQEQQKQKDAGDPLW
jgi:hypothetical protein